MKYLSITFLLLIPSIILAQKSQISYKIFNLKDFNCIQFYTEDYDTVYHSQDSLGSFEYKFDKEEPLKIHFAINDNYKHEGILYVENEILILYLSSDKGYNVQVENAPNTNLSNKVFKFNRNSSAVYMQVFRQMLLHKKDSEMYNYWGNEYTNYRNKTDEKVNKIYSTHKDKFATLSYCKELLDSKYLSQDKIKTLFYSLDKKLIDSRLGKEIAKELSIEEYKSQDNIDSHVMVNDSEQKIDLKQEIRKGEHYLVFYTTNCSYTDVFFKKLATTTFDTKKITAISLDEKISTWKELLDERKPKGDHLHVAKKEVGSKFWIDGYPTIIKTKDGKFVERVKTDEFFKMLDN